MFSFSDLDLAVGNPVLLFLLNFFYIRKIFHFLWVKLSLLFLNWFILHGEVSMRDFKLSVQNMDIFVIPGSQQLIGSTKN